MDPNKDVVLDVSSTSSDSEDDFVSPLTQLANTSAAATGAKRFIFVLFSFLQSDNGILEELSILWNVIILCIITNLDAMSSLDELLAVAFSKIDILHSSHPRNC